MARGSGVLSVTEKLTTEMLCDEAQQVGARTAAVGSVNYYVKVASGLFVAL